jgi:hypothetical protein
MLTRAEIEALSDEGASYYVAEKIMGYRNPSYHFLETAHNLNDSVLAAAKLGCRLEIIIWPGNPALVRAEWPNDATHDFWTMEFEHVNASRAACNAVIAANEARPQS